MKTVLAVLLTLAGLVFSTTAFADCYSCNNSCNTCNSCSNDCACRNKCACTEPSCGRNPCLSRCDCCKAFGNVGGYVEE